jgi:PIN domain nuclease of toxin-antitoxin system
LRLLLDTCALIWFLEDDRRLSRTVKAAIEDPGGEIFVSAVSAYEIELKRHSGKAFPALPLALAQAVAQAGFVLLPITFAHATAAGRFAGPHRDPWDRLLAAQALDEALPIATPDPVFGVFGCRVLW